MLLNSYILVLLPFQGWRLVSSHFSALLDLAIFPALSLNKKVSSSSFMKLHILYLGALFFWHINLRAN